MVDELFSGSAVLWNAVQKTDGKGAGAGSEGVRYIQDRRDRRCTHNHLTAEAMDVIGKLRQVYEKVYSIVLNGVTEEELTVLTGVAQKVGRNISSAISD